MKTDGTKTSSYAEAAEVLANFFSGVYIKEDVTNIPEFPTSCGVHINSLSVTQEDLLQNYQLLVLVKLWAQIKYTHGY